MCALCNIDHRCNVCAVWSVETMVKFLAQKDLAGSDAGSGGPRGNRGAPGSAGGGAPRPQLEVAEMAPPAWFGLALQGFSA